MRAVGVSRYGGPEVLEVVELPEPVPGDGEVCIRVGAAEISGRQVRSAQVPEQHGSGNAVGGCDVERV